jgi:Transglutaminase-like superfamily
LIIEAAIVALLAPALARLPLNRLEYVLEPRRPRRGLEEHEADVATARVVRAVDRVMRRGRPLIRSGCLTRGITRFLLLRRAGVDVSLCFGVGVVDGAFVAHCWLDRAGCPILETADPRGVFPEVARIPGVRAAVG